jgi:hypothetical protein
MRPEDIRRYGDLPTAAGMLRVRVHCWFYGLEHLGQPLELHGKVLYIGSTAAMLAAGCLTPFMLATRQAWSKGLPMRDEHGERFGLSRTANRPGSMTLTLRRIDIALPGVRDLFPDGLPEPEPVEAQRERAKQRTRGHLTVIDGLAPLPRAERWATAQEWKRDLLDGIASAHPPSLFEIGVAEKLSGGRFQLDEADMKRTESIEARYREELLSALERASVTDSREPRRQPRLRLVTSALPAAGQP